MADIEGGTVSWVADPGTTKQNIRLPPRVTPAQSKDPIYYAQVHITYFVKLNPALFEGRCLWSRMRCSWLGPAIAHVA